MVTTKQAVDWIGRCGADCGAFENVMGFAYRQSEHARSPLDSLILQMRDLGYTIEAVEVCSSSFVALVRCRSRLLFLNCCGKHPFRAFLAEPVESE